MARHDMRESTLHHNGDLPEACKRGDCRHARHQVSTFGYGAYYGAWVAPLQGAQFAGLPQVGESAGSGSGGDSGGDGGGDGGGI